MSIATTLPLISSYIFAELTAFLSKSDVKLMNPFVVA